MGAAFSTWNVACRRLKTRRVVHRHDTDHCGRHIAGVHAVVDDHLDEAVVGGGIVAGVAVENLLQRRFVVVEAWPRR